MQNKLQLSQGMYQLHLTAMLICGVIGVVIFGVMFYSLIQHRKSKSHQARAFHKNLKLEIFWTIIPFMIIIALTIPAMLHMKNPFELKPLEHVYEKQAAYKKRIDPHELSTPL